MSVIAPSRVSAPIVAPDSAAVRPALRVLGTAPPNLESLLPDYLVLSRVQSGRASLHGLVGASHDRASRLSRRLGHVLRLEEGLLQVPRFGPGLPWVSLAVPGAARDGVAAPGWTEAALLGPQPVEAGCPAVARLRAARVGGTCWADPPSAALLHAVGRGLVLVRPGRDAARGRTMLRAALAQSEAARVLLLAPARGGIVREAAALGCRVLREPVDPWPLLDMAVELHVDGDDELALLGLVAGVEVHCHRPGAYAGWGATQDHGVPARTVRRTGAQVAAAALGDGLRCADPFRAGPAPVEDTIDLLVEWRRLAQANRGVGCLAGMSAWKRRRMAGMFHTGLRAPAVRRTAGGAVAEASLQGGAVAVWSSRVPAGLLVRAAAAGVGVLRVEDGFIRSVGLGCDFLPPCSVVVDRRGMYFDPSRPSDLEHLLATARFTPELRERGRRLAGLLVERGITKYNTGRADTAPPAPPGVRRILVPGQVADDASVRLGGGEVRGNLSLLARVREANPGAHITYKPHPDVDAGHRPGRLSEAEMRAHADQVVRGVSMAALVATTDEVHTLTSLAGFEALLRGCRVVTYGQPFYAGWGLTEDLAPIARRGRQLGIAELVAGALILYPRYLDPLTGLPCPPEVLIERLADPLLWRPGPLMRARRLQGRVSGWLHGMRDGR